MSTPEPPSGPPVEAPHPEPGHRARALAASLLGELTGQRKSGLSFSPLEATGLSVVDRTPAAQDAQAAPEATHVVTPEPTPVVTPAVIPTAPAPSLVTPAVTPTAPTSASEADTAAPSTASVTSGDAPLRSFDSPASRLAPPAPAAAPTAPAATSGAGLAAQEAQQSAPATRSSERGSASVPDVRPAPFEYLAVAAHHTAPARATADGALDQAGQRISSRVDRALVRRAALVTIEAASLLDACDVLDGRARAADATWTGEHHSPTEVREFEGAWGAFYDAQGALAQHVQG